MRVADALPTAIRQLLAAGVPEAAQDARKLLAHALGIAADRLTLILPDPLPEPAHATFENLVAARCRRQPLAQIIGQRLFWGRWFEVTGDVLDPRPETECLIAAALGQQFSRVLDLGIGSGAILLSLLAERPAATGIGVDLSPAALVIAAANARRLGLEDRVDLILSDWFDAVSGRFDLIVANPPYIAGDELALLAPEVRDWEPHLALSPGADGLAAYRRIVAAAPGQLAPNGVLMVETGPTQSTDVAGLFRLAGFAAIEVLADMDGRDRVVLGHYR